MTKELFNAFSHLNESDLVWRSDGLRSFFEYADLGIREATGGRVIAQLVRAAAPPTWPGTGWHYHGARFHIVAMRSGWARFMYEDRDTLVKAGDWVHQRPGIRHCLYDWSPDMCFLEVVGPADFTTVQLDGGPADIPQPGRFQAAATEEIKRKLGEILTACSGSRVGMFA
jgi:mannose-6-phosphate isomerase-like protein (cupin superfamily)